MWLLVLIFDSCVDITILLFSMDEGSTIGAIWLILLSWSKLTKKIDSHPFDTLRGFAICKSIVKTVKFVLQIEKRCL